MDLQVKKFRGKAYNIFKGPLFYDHQNFNFRNEPNNYCKFLRYSKYNSLLTINFPIYLSFLLHCTKYIDMPKSYVNKISSLLIANRGEIAIRIMRAASELGIRTVAVYTFEDRYSLHRYKADEAYQIGKENEPLKPYLDIEGLISLCKSKKIDAIHPGYGFLSENVKLALRCREEGIVFVGPSPEALKALGDKVAAKVAAHKANVPMIQDSKGDLSDYALALSEAKRITFPVMVKAAARSPWVEV